MKLLRRVLEQVSKHLPARRIVDNDGGPYLTKYYLFGKMPPEFADMWDRRPTERLGWLNTTCLHRFYRPDMDRDCHNHPWSATGRILTGGYVEERWVGDPREDHAYLTMRCLLPGEYQQIEANTFHRIVELGDDEVWTLFRTSDKVQSWGFWVEAQDRFQPWREYLAERGRYQP